MTTPDNPIDYFAQWFAKAEECSAIQEHNAVNLATASPEGIPSNRTVLLKGYGEDGFVFYTNLESRKGEELKANPVAAMCFYWEPLSRQIRIEGKIKQVSSEQADAYFATRPLQSRIGAWASKQSRPLDSVSTLMKEIAKHTARFAAGDVPRPDFWSGFRLIPEYMEFWQKGEYRIHNRLCYRRCEGGSWKKFLLYP